MKTLYNIYFISVFFISVANAGISDTVIESFLISCINKLIPTTNSPPQIEKKETEEEPKISDRALRDLKEKKPISTYYTIETKVSDVCHSFYNQKDEKQISDTLSSISEQAVSNEKDILEKSEGEWQGKLSDNQIELLASFLLTNNAIYDYVEARESRGKKDGYFVSSVGASYMDDDESVYNSLDHYKNAETHRFPIMIAVILNNASLNADAKFGINNSRSSKE